ncbi:MAG: hypothetical protein RLW61_10855 [Gammaproteobacteria bacterium]
MNDYYTVGTSPIVFSVASQATANGVGSRYSSSYVGHVALGISNYLYDDFTRDPLDITLLFGYETSWDMSLARDVEGQANGFVTLGYAVDSVLSSPFDVTEIYNAAFGAALGFPADIDEATVAHVVGPASGLFAVALGDVDYAEITFQASVASFTRVDAAPVPLPAGIVLLLSVVPVLVRGWRRAG